MQFEEWFGLSKSELFEKMLEIKGITSGRGSLSIAKAWARCAWEARQKEVEELKDKLKDIRDFVNDLLENEDLWECYRKFGGEYDETLKREIFMKLHSLIKDLTAKKLEIEE